MTHDANGGTLDHESGTHRNWGIWCSPKTMYSGKNIGRMMSVWVSVGVLVRKSHRVGANKKTAILLRNIDKKS